MHGAEDGKEKRSPGARFVNFVMPAKAGIHRPRELHDQAALCLHPCQQTQRHALRRGHERPRTARLGTQIRHDRWLYEQYGVHDLVYADFHETMLDAITREKQMKRWRRAWKLRLIARSNPDWRDLSADLAR